MRVLAAFRSEVEPSLARRAGLHVVGPGWSWTAEPALPGTGLVLITGSCGALGAQGRSGDLVLPEWVEARGVHRLPDPAAAARVAARASELGLPLVRGGLAEAPGIVDSPVERATLGGGGAQHADGESARLAEASERAGRPWLVLRFVTDTASEPLGWLRELLGAWPVREPGWTFLAARLATHPAALPRLVRLGGIVRASRRRIADLAADLGEDTGSAR